MHYEKGSDNANRCHDFGSMFALPIVWWCAQFLSQAWADSQVPLLEDVERQPPESVVSRAAGRKLQGRFLHITGS